MDGWDRRGLWAGDNGRSAAVHPRVLVVQRERNAGLIAGLATAGLLATVLPARRGSGVEPMEALGEE
jgi:hypothetical protein